MDLKIDVSQRMDVNLRAKTRRKTAKMIYKVD